MGIGEHPQHIEEADKLVDKIGGIYNIMEELENKKYSNSIPSIPIMFVPKEGGFGGLGSVKSIIKHYKNFIYYIN